MAHPVAGCIILALVAASVAGVAFADDAFPLTGNYTQNVPCKGDGTDPAVSEVTISPQEIVSNVGVCTILDTKRDGDSILPMSNASSLAARSWGHHLYAPPRQYGRVQRSRHELQIGPLPLPELNRPREPGHVLRCATAP